MLFDALFAVPLREKYFGVLTRCFPRPSVVLLEVPFGDGRFWNGVFPSMRVGFPRWRDQKPSHERERGTVAELHPGTSTIISGRMVHRY